MSVRKWVLVLGVATLAACAHGRIPGTQIPNTEPNREVYAVVRKALDALASRDSKTLLSVVSTRYFESNGTPQPEDDYGYEQLKNDILPKMMTVTKEVFIEAQVQEIDVNGDRAHADIRYSSRARLELPSGSRWDSHRDFDRITLDREPGGWKITGGL
jgi:hypothetical protein